MCRNDCGQYGCCCGRRHLWRRDHRVELNHGAVLAGDHSLTPGGSYTLSAELESATAGIYGYVGNLTAGTQQGGDPTSWTTYSVPVTAPGSGSITIYIQVYKEQTGTVYFDNVSLTAQ